MWQAVASEVQNYLVALSLRTLLDLLSLGLVEFRVKLFDKSTNSWLSIANRLSRFKNRSLSLGRLRKYKLELYKLFKLIEFNLSFDSKVLSSLKFEISYRKRWICSLPKALSPFEFQNELSLANVLARESQPKTLTKSLLGHSEGSVILSVSYSNWQCQFT